jgi:thiol-disulfide isomerase/thioredoxin
VTGLWIVLAALALALGFGGLRQLRDGRARADHRQASTPAAALALGGDLGTDATFLQFSAPVCAPCRATHRVLSEVAAADPALAHIEVDAASRLDLVSEFGIARTPTVLLLDSDGIVRHRIVGAPRRGEVDEALRLLRGSRAA